ncbi:gephyrin-like molybdotransferase Glp [Corynebacterium kroppenstedtii]|uniref:molybdotransferase-like divisome protein Glp n=1 Tax=Corynebacterium sp. PCR 32 TaxID=3351342 RepID=UPI0030963AF8
MRSVEEQLAIIADAAVTPEPVRVSISDSLGLRSAEEVRGDRPVPGFNQAAIDGYAVRAVDLVPQQMPSESPGDAEDAQRPLMDQDNPGDRPSDGRSRRFEELPVVGDVGAGSHKPLRLQPNQAVRVETGAPVPTLSDAIVPEAWVERRGRRIRPLFPVKSGDFIHRAGTDVLDGDVIVSEGTVLGAAHIGLLAAVGRSKVLVYPRPRVSVMSIGQELIASDRQPGRGQVFDVNSYSLAAAAEEAGADAHRVGVIAGEPKRLQEIVEGQILRSEIIVIAGAVGGSAARRMREIVSGLGDIEYTRVAMHPGSTQGFGLLGPNKVPTFLLPSNPVGALIIFETMVRPLIQFEAGRRRGRRRIIQARALHGVSSMPGRRGFIRGQLMRDRGTDEYLVDPLGASAGAPQHLLGSFAEANCLIHVPEDVVGIAPGDVVDVLFLSNRA